MICTPSLRITRRVRCRHLGSATLFLAVRTRFGSTRQQGSLSVVACSHRPCSHRAAPDIEVKQVISPALISLSSDTTSHTGAQILLSQLPDFSSLGWVSMLGAVCSIGYSAIATGLAGAHGREANITYAPAKESNPLNEAINVFAAISTILFAYGGHNVSLEIQATLPNPPTRQRMMRGVHIAFIITGECCGWALLAWARSVWSCSCLKRAYATDSDIDRPHANQTKPQVRSILQSQSAATLPWATRPAPTSSSRSKTALPGCATWRACWWWCTCSPRTKFTPTPYLTGLRQPPGASAVGLRTEAWRLG